VGQAFQPAVRLDSEVPAGRLESLPHNDGNRTDSYKRITKGQRDMELIATVVFGGAAVVAALLVVFSKNTVHSALWMVANCLALAVLFLLMNSQFIAILQVIVYAGAIMMFILYAIMMLNLRANTGEADIKTTLLTGRFVVLLLFFIGLLVLGVGLSPLALKGDMGSEALSSFGEVNLLANYIFVEGLCPFELVSVLLTAAVVGAVFLAKKEPDEI
jgi:NADH-quinone oxidoreductase subunit J